jgi:sec-independent protein translocase protein TatA
VGLHRSFRKGRDMGALSPLHLVIILVVALLVLGPAKLPETGAALGQAVRDFRHALSEDVPETKPHSPSGPSEVVSNVEPTRRQSPPTAPTGPSDPA